MGNNGRIYEDDEVDAYYRQRRQPVSAPQGVQVIGSALLVIFVIIILILNINYLLQNR